MTASKMIEALQKAIAEHGDLPVVYSTREEAYEVSRLHFTPDGYFSVEDEYRQVKTAALYVE